MHVKVDLVRFRWYTQDMLELGRMDMAIQLNKLSDNVSEHWAQEKYKKRFTHWVKDGLISGNKQSGGATSPRYFSRIELEILDRSEKYELYE